jgi:hypothetical protein
MEQITIYILKDENGFSLNSTKDGDYGVVSDNLNEAIGMAKEIIRNGFANDFCIDE